MLKVTVNGEVLFVDGEPGLLALIQHVMGPDVHEELLEFMERSRCGGECEKTYALQEHYERVIRDAMENLKAAMIPGKIGKVDVVAFSHAINTLEEEL